ncbi:hypothetical protein K0M31_000942 [Melipona bicolor]|uniref:Uncharacterized protein n=1 Tax=Melipona bicolor TaxID=60889 RepID=A0AA40KX73_9HYME|nr:hypothetical protein K0M31_000942 [Melipona bicolor]
MIETRKYYAENINMADQDYDMGPATEMMINDFDDERTLDEEEALEGSEDSHNELSNLQKDQACEMKKSSP